MQLLNINKKAIYWTMSIEKTYSYSMRPVISSARKLMAYKYDRDVQFLILQKAFKLLFLRSLLKVLISFALRGLMLKYIRQHKSAKIYPKLFFLNHDNRWGRSRGNEFKGYRNEKTLFLILLL